MLPFTRDQFLANLVAYNEAIWPAQLAAFALGLLAVALLFWRRQMADRLIVGTLAIMWLWTGVGYHWLHFAEINKAALIFGGLFVAPGAMLAYVGVVRERTALRAGFWTCSRRGNWFGRLCGRPLPPSRHLDGSRISANAGVLCHALSGDDFHLRFVPLRKASYVAVVDRDPVHLVVDRRECSAPPRRAARLVTSRQRCCCSPVGACLSRRHQFGRFEVLSLPIHHRCRIQGLLGTTAVRI